MIQVASTPQWRARERRREQLFQLVGALIVLFALTTLVVLLTKILLDGFARLNPEFFTSFPRAVRRMRGFCPRWWAARTCCCSQRRLPSR
jgi:ABC-type phosphate transport system permease subunit